MPNSVCRFGVRAPRRWTASAAAFGRKRAQTMTIAPTNLIKRGFMLENLRTTGVGDSKPERARRLASEEPGRADAQALVPRRQSQGVEREARLSRELAADDPSLYEHRRVVRAEADGLAQLLEVSGSRDAAVYERLHVACDEARLLVCELRRARQIRRDVGEVRDVAEREDFRMAPHL